MVAVDAIDKAATEGGSPRSFEGSSAITWNRSASCMEVITVLELAPKRYISTSRDSH